MDFLPTLVASWKTIPAFPGWSAPEPETGYMRFSASLEIDGLIEEGFTFSGGCYRDQPDRHVTFELRLTIPKARQTIPLERMDWRSPRGHTNPRNRASSWAGRRVSNTHLHAFNENWIPHETRMRVGNLPVAVEIDEELQTFAQLIQFVGKQFRIKNIDVVTMPEWEYKLV